MSRSRCHLHFKHLDEFRDFCVSQGWVNEGPKGDYEALRMRHPNHKDLLIVHQKNSASQHFTTWGLSERMSRAFFRSQRGAAEGPKEVTR